MGKEGSLIQRRGSTLIKYYLSRPANYLNALRKANDQSWRRDRWSYLRNLSGLFAKNRVWGMGFMNALALSTDSDSGVYREAFSAWRNIITKTGDWEWFLDEIERLPQNYAICAGVAHQISNGIWAQEPKMPHTLVMRAAVLMYKAWDVCSKAAETPDDNYRRWLDAAINHEGGWIGEFWIHYCSYLRRRSGKKWKGIPASLKVRMREALSGVSRVKVYARIAMTPWMDYIFVWDRRFAEENFLPLLDWQRDPIVAQQTWSVLLNYRRAKSVEMESRLLPYYRQVAERIKEMLTGDAEKAEQFDENALRSLGHYLASLAMHVIPNPVNSGFFHEFLPLLPENVRTSLARGIGDVLKVTPAEKMKSIWNTWLKDYLDLRLVGVPWLSRPKKQGLWLIGAFT